MQGTGTIIKTLRLNAGLSIPELAERAQIDHTTLWRIESGRTLPRITTLRAVARALNLPVGTLLEKEIA